MPGAHFEVGYVSFLFASCFLLLGIFFNWLCCDTAVVVISFALLTGLYMYDRPNEYKPYAPSVYLVIARDIGQ